MKVLIEFIFIITPLLATRFSHKQNLHVNETENKLWLIKDFYALTKFKCLSICNLNEACLSLTYESSSATCALYAKTFATFDLLASNSTDMYFKTGKCGLDLAFFFSNSNRF